jgi:excisionase family DNA binding protein
MKAEEMLTTPQAAEKLGVSTARVRQLILEGRLPSQQFGRDHLIKESDLDLVADRKTGRPKKTDETETRPAPPPHPPFPTGKPKKATNGGKKATKKRAAKKLR